MQAGSSDLTSLRAIKEVTWGVTPGTGNLTQIRFTGESMDANTETTVSKEIRPDRMTSDLIPVGQAAGGSIDIEMSHGSFDDYIEGALFSSFSADLGIVAVSGDISSTASGFSSTDLTKLDAIVEGQWFEVRGFATNSGENNGFYRATAAVDGSGVITTSIAPPSIETPAGTSAEIHGKMIRNGITSHSFTLEKRFEGLAVTTYQVFPGSMVAGFSQNYSVGEVLTGSLEFLSKQGSMTAVALAGLTDTPAPASDLLNAVDNMKNILIDDSATTKEFLSLGLEVGNNLRGQKAIGSLGNVGVGVGKLDVTGAVSVYFEDKTEMDKFEANTPFSLSFRLEDASGNAYIYTFGKVKYENLSVTAGGENSDLVAEGSWRALLDTTTNSMIQIDSFTAA